MHPLYRQRQRLINHWSEIDRAMLPLVIMMLLLLISWLMTQVAVNTPEIHHHYNLEFAKGRYRLWHLVLACLWGALLAWGLWARRHPGRHRRFSYAVALALGIGNTLFVYLPGIFVGPFMVGYVATGVVILMLFEPKPAYSAVLASIVLLLALWLGETLQLIPSAPLFRDIPFYAGVAERWWVVMMGALVILISFIALGVSAVVIARERRSEAALLYLSETDFLTGLYNRRAFLRLAEAELSRARRHNAPTAMAMLDLDHFKRVNDEYGHDSGDEILAGVADILRQSLRLHDHVCRWGGEEFVLLLSDIAERDVHAVFERLRLAIQETRFELAGGKELQITVSIGYTIAGPDHGRIEAMDLIAAADHAVYRAKDAGRNRTIYDPFLPPEEPDQHPAQDPVPAVD